MVATIAKITLTAAVVALLIAGGMGKSSERLPKVSTETAIVVPQQK